MIVRYQLDNTESGLADYTGLSFMELYRLCRSLKSLGYFTVLGVDRVGNFNLL